MSEVETSKQCMHAELKRAKTGGWFCVGIDCNFEIPECASETKSQPVAWRRATDSPYENHPRYVYTDDEPAPGVLSKFEPLYAAPAQKASVPQQPPIDNEHVAPGCEKFDE